MRDDHSTRDLLEQARRGDLPARERLAARLLTRLGRWARGKLPAAARDKFDTMDIVQECVMRTMMRLEAFEWRHDRSLESYLRPAIRNRIRNEVRRVGLRPFMVESTGEERDPSISPLDEVFADEEREAVRLRLDEGWEYARIAAATGLPSADAARMAVARALAKVARELERADRGAAHRP